jgi:3-oxoacyl-[acyl-carrier protein] reductase
MSEALFNKQKVLIVGGTRNIGLAIATDFMRHGADICIIGGYSKSNLKEALQKISKVNGSGSVCGKIADMSKRADVENVFTFFDECYNEPPRILINCQGYRPHNILAEISDSEWDQVMNRNVKGPFITSQEFFKRVPGSVTASIVNIGGLSAHKPAKERAHVITSKAAIIGLTRALAEEGRNHIKVNCIVPGVIDTKREIGQPQAAFINDNEFLKGSTSDVSEAVLYFANPNTVYITGQTLHVNGGRFMP